jgi:thioredoxin family protein
VIEEERYERGQTFQDFLASAEKNAEFWRGVWAKSRVEPAIADRVRATGRNWRILVLSEDWCGDAVNLVPVIARLAEACPNVVDMRLFPRDQNLDLMDAHLTGSSRSIPVVILLDDQYRECGWWGPRPAELQRWVLGPGQDLPKDERYRETRRWYARDGGRTTLEEITRLLEAC